MHIIRNALEKGAYLESHKSSAAMWMMKIIKDRTLIKLSAKFAGLPKYLPQYYYNQADKK
ncbi:MAG TPA: hypothetical protein DCM38_06730 [Gammaproteobacteria bacterium]|nr:hypothetical protein [Gammaproteobacteria bacterium]